MGFRAIYGELIGEVWRGKKRTRAQAQYLSFIDNRSYTTLFGKRHARSRVSAQAQKDGRRTAEKARTRNGPQKIHQKQQKTEAYILHFTKIISFSVYMENPLSFGFSSIFHY